MSARQQRPLEELVQINNLCIDFFGEGISYFVSCIIHNHPLPGQRTERLCEAATYTLKMKIHEHHQRNSNQSIFRCGISFNLQSKPLHIPEMDHTTSAIYRGKAGPFLHPPAGNNHL